MTKSLIHICTGGKTCPKKGSCDLAVKLKKTIESMGVTDKVEMVEEKCMGLCKTAPNIMVTPQGKQYGHVAEADLKTIINESIATAPKTTVLESK